jgi:hypothetical protein
VTSAEKLQSWVGHGYEGTDFTWFASVTSLFSPPFLTYYPYSIRTHVFRAVKTHILEFVCRDVPIKNILFLAGHREFR